MSFMSLGKGGGGHHGGGHHGGHRPRHRGGYAPSYGGYYEAPVEYVYEAARCEPTLEQLRYWCSKLRLRGLNGFYDVVQATPNAPSNRPLDPRNLGLGGVLPTSNVGNLLLGTALGVAGYFAFDWWRKR